MSESEMEVQRALGRIEGKLDEILELPKRVSSLERSRAWMKGAGAVLTAIVIYKPLFALLSILVNG